MDGRHRRVEWL